MTFKYELMDALHHAIIHYDSTIITSLSSLKRWFHDVGIKLVIKHPMMLPSKSIAIANYS